MSAFSEAELAYLLGERRLGRVATVGKDGTPHVVPVGWSYNADQDSIDVGGREFERADRLMGDRQRDMTRGRGGGITRTDPF
jgi:pyridoxamine 5'-phosphate oxidase family protein